ncbi:hypothetical protein [Cupriavidus oxalaticus]|uniref:Uncharacterized protein n=1 Tax=Cupriavidus oxalaticus TaxID=96344 RepID=A0A5P3VR33_9BURK|nr:hypothetical protein [Cupriavidus oxalaticus]QEZ48816.1 hypothetical protein D2917_31575 [Cupriavidus oxalaticus]
MPAFADAQLRFAPVLTEGKTVADVVRQLEDALRGTELEPEWLNAANFPNDDNEAMYGPKPSRPWPVLGARDRLAVYLQRGWSEGWSVFVDRVGYIGNAPNLTTTAEKLLIGKTLTERQGWDVVRAIAKMLDAT